MNVFLNRKHKCVMSLTPLVEKNKVVKKLKL